MPHYCSNCRAILYVYSLGYCPNCREPYPLPHGYVCEGEAFLIGIKTKLDNMELLIQSLRELDLTVRRNCYVRGKSGKTTAEVVVALDCGCDLGYFLEDGKFVSVYDYFCLDKCPNLIKLFKQIDRKYQDLLAQQGDR